MSQSKNYQKTMYACFIGYIVQAVVNNFVPLLFVVFQDSYHIPLSQITALITINFLIQLGVDLLSAGVVDKLGYRTCVLLAHGCAAAGLVLLAFLPDLLPNPLRESSSLWVSMPWAGDSSRCSSVPFWRRAPRRTRRKP